ncbi:MAG: hypothetical protein J6B60_05185 [Clostridia bacterium]|nr:hypothetical protein [Clostridia bacterium]
MTQDIKKRKIRFNFTDVLIILIIGVIIAAIIYACMGNDIAQIYSPREDIEYTLIVEDGNYGFKNSVFNESGKRIGTVEKVFRSTDKNGHSVAFLTVSCNAYIQNGEYFSKGQLIKDGLSLNVKIGENEVVYATVGLTAGSN